MLRRNRWTTLGLMGLFALVGACESTTDPGDQVFDADEAVEDYEAMDAVLQSQAWDDFRAASAQFSFGDGGSADLPAALAQTLDGLDNVRGGQGEELARGVMASLGELPTYGEAVISEAHRGVTFVWDSEFMEYVASELEGAPTNGVRFILYELDGEDQPIVENEIGRADLLDEGDLVDEVVLRLTATANDVNFLDYRVEMSNPEAGSFGLDIDGFLRNETDQLDFDIAVSESTTEVAEILDITFDASIDSRDFSIAMALNETHTEAGKTVDVSLTVTHGRHVLAVVGGESEGILDATISLNGEPFATMTGDPENPTFNSADGDGFTAGELEMLGRVGEVAEDVFAFFGELVEPAIHIILLGLVL